MGSVNLDRCLPFHLPWMMCCKVKRLRLLPKQDSILLLKTSHTMRRFCFVSSSLPFFRFGSGQITYGALTIHNDFHVIARAFCRDMDHLNALAGFRLFGNKF